jgi:RNA polymerase sigma-70 factor (ECF subfamily)
LNLNTTYEPDELVARLKQGSASAIDQLYEKYAPALYTVILQIVRDEALANIVLLNAFKDVMDNIGTYDSQRERLLIWLFKIARNAAIAVVRSANELDSLEKQAEQTVEKIAGLEIDNYGLKKLIIKLKDDQRILLDLCYYKGYTYDEIAKTLDIPVETVSKKLKMAVLELKAVLI